MFSFYQQGLAPSVPSAVVALTPSLLAVAQDNLLVLYRTVLVSKDSGETRLEWVCESKLLGNVSSMCSLTVLGKQLLVLSFADAKMSLLEYSEDLHSFVTVSIHYYEKEEFKKDAQMHKLPPQLYVDPQSRLVAMRFFGDRLAIMPFKTEMQEEGPGENGPLTKQPYLPSHVIAFSTIDASIKRVVDMAFLADYFEPTLAILYETLPTWTGHLSKRRDNRALIVVSLSKSYPVLYKIENLPYNCYKVLSVPSPTGGLVVVCPNGLIHVDQAGTPASVAVNSYFGYEDTLWNEGKKNPLYTSAGDYRSLAVSLEGSEAAFLNPDTLLLVPRSGETLVFDLIGHEDAGRGWGRKRNGVREIQVSRLGARGPMPSVIVRLGPWSQSPLLLWGSRAGDSLLLRLTENTSTTITTHGNIGSKVMAVDNDGDDFLEDDLYGTNETLGNNQDGGPSQSSLASEHHKNTRFTVQVLDSLNQLAPIRDMALGEPASYSDVSLAKPKGHTDLEVVLCTGESHSGALGIVSRSVRPQIVSSFDLEGVIEMWSIKCSPDKNAELTDGSPEGFHSFLFLSRENGTLILRTGEEFTQVSETDSEFYTAGPTVNVASVLNDSMILQVEPNNLILLDFHGVKKATQEVGGDDVWIVSASIVDPYILVLTNQGEVLVYQVLPLLTIEHVHAFTGKSVSAASLYRNFQKYPRLPTAKKLQEFNLHNSNKRSTTNGLYASDPLSSVKAPQADHDMDDLDAELYGDENAADETMDTDLPESNSAVPSEEETEKEYGYSYWCLIYGEDGSLQILSLPDFTECFFVPNFDYLPNLVYDCPKSDDLVEKKRTPYDLNEIIMVNLGPSEDRQDAYLIVTTDQNEYAIYKVFTHLESYDDKIAELETRLAIRMTRVRRDIMCREPKVYAEDDEDKLRPLDKRPRPTFLKKHRLAPFSKIGLEGTGLFSGVFITGKTPVWLMMAGQGGPGAKLEIFDATNSSSLHLKPSFEHLGKRKLQQHPMPSDGPITAFAPIHNVSIRHGFVYMTEGGNLRICQLPAQFDYGSDWPACKISLGKTPMRVTSHYASRTYVMATCSPVPFQLSRAQYTSAIAAEVIKDGEPIPDSEVRTYGLKDSQRDEGMYWPETSAYKLELVSPVTWETVDSFDLQETEYITALQVVELESKETATGFKLYIAIGTSYMRSEDLTVRGRVLIYDIIEVVPEIDNPQTCHKFKKMAEIEEKAPISALCAVNGYLLTGQGAKIVMYSFEDQELTGVAFYDVSVYVTDLAAVKGLILASDVTKSVFFFAFQEEPPKLTLLGKDFYPMRVYQSNFIVDGKNLGFAITDSMQNLHLMAYDPYSVQSLGGQKLVSIGQLHIGSHVSKMMRLMTKALGKDDVTAQLGCVMDILASSNGSVSHICPVSEKVYRRLYSLYSRMVTSLQHFAGLNPRGYRHVQHIGRPLAAANTIASGPPGPKSVLDGDCLLTFLNLSFAQQQELASTVGSSVERIMDDLLSVLSQMNYF